MILQNKKVTLILCSFFLIIQCKGQKDSINNTEVFHPRGYNVTIMKISDSIIYTAKCQDDRVFCDIHNKKKMMNIVEKKCFNNGNICIYKIENLERYSFNNSLKTSRFVFAKIEKDGFKYHFVSSDLKYSKESMDKIELTKSIFSEKEIKERIKKYFSSKANPNTYTTTFYAKSFLEGLNNHSIKIDSTFNETLKDLVKKEMDEGRLKYREIGSFVNEYLIERKMNPIIYKRSQPSKSFKK